MRPTSRNDLPRLGAPLRSRPRQRRLTSCIWRNARMETRISMCRGPLNQAYAAPAGDSGHDGTPPGVLDRRAWHPGQSDHGYELRDRTDRRGRQRHNQCPEGITPKGHGSPHRHRAHPQGDRRSTTVRHERPAVDELHRTAPAVAATIASLSRYGLRRGPRTRSPTLVIVQVGAGTATARARPHLRPRKRLADACGSGSSTDLAADG